MAHTPYAKWMKYKSDLTTEFYTHIADLLENDKVMALDHFIHHYCFTRLKHSLDVAYISFMIARILHWNSRSVARAGLLHDLYLYDWREEHIKKSDHVRHHPKAALENARSVCELTAKEEDIILRHMWLATLRPPRYKEGYIVTLVDKCCATSEMLKSVFTRSHLRTVSEST
jgi:uncharacterized protein